MFFLPLPKNLIIYAITNIKSNVSANNLYDHFSTVNNYLKNEKTKSMPDNIEPIIVPPKSPLYFV